MNVPRLEIRKTIHAPREAVFKALTSKEGIARWFSTPKAAVSKVEIEPRVGGTLVIECAFQGGVWRMEGVIREYQEPQRLAFTWVTSDIPASAGSLVKIELREQGDNTEVLLTQDGFPSTDKRRDNEGGWTELMQNLAKEVGRA